MTLSLCKSNGTVHKTKSIQVEVSSKIKKPAVRKSPSNLFDMFHDAFDRDSFFSIPRIKEPIDKDTFQLKTQIKDRNIYIGEMLPVSWSIYKKSNSRSRVFIESADSIQPEGFWIEKVKDTTRLSFDTEIMLNNVPYRKALLFSYMLFPLKTGMLEIPSIEVQLATQSFSMFSSDTIKIKSNPVLYSCIPSSC